MRPPAFRATDKPPSILDGSWTPPPPSPGADKEANWLPAPKGDFLPMLRMYWPKEALLNGSWAPPAVKREAALVGTPVGPSTRPE